MILATSCRYSVEVGSLYSGMKSRLILKSIMMNPTTMSGGSVAGVVMSGLAKVVAAEI